MFKNLEIMRKRFPNNAPVTVTAAEMCTFCSCKSAPTLPIGFRVKKPFRFCIGVQFKCHSVIVIFTSEIKITSYNYVGMV